MQLFGLAAAAALAGGVALAPPADAQYYRHHAGWHGNNGWHGNGGGHRGYRGGWHGRSYGGRYRHGYGYRPAYGYGGYGYGHRRVICRLHRGYYGVVRRCVRVWH